MRIIGGKNSGQIIKFPKIKGVRPTTEKVREAIFSILREKIKKSFILDLYSGSGSLGIEALSRGAKKVIFIDNNKTCFNTIKQNLIRTNFLNFAEVKKIKAEDFLRKIKNKYIHKFDLIFIDPPWSKINFSILDSLFNYLKNQGIIIFLHSKKIKIKGIKKLFIYDQRKYGDSVVTFLKLNKK